MPEIPASGSKVLLCQLCMIHLCWTAYPYHKYDVHNIFCIIMECCATKRYEGQGQVITPHCTCGM